MKTDQTPDQPAKSLAELAREYRTAKDAADKARESVKPATKAASEARAALVTALKPFDVGGRWIVTPIPAVHDAAEPVGFHVVAADGDRLLYLTDTAYCAHRFEQLRIVMVEANYSSELLRHHVTSGMVEAQVAARTIRNHMSLERCIDLLNANDLSGAREVHLLHLSNPNSSAAEFKAAVERATGVPTYVAPERSVTA